MMASLLLKPFRAGARHVLRPSARWAGRTLLRGLMKPMTAAELSQPAVVIAPHQDDETIGCGGTIVRKRRANVPVKIVLMTDGSASHAGLIDGQELAALRSNEVVAAAKTLGVGENDVLQLRFQDGQLFRHTAEAIARIRAILERERPAQVFIPYYQDGSTDHLATTRIVYAATEEFFPDTMIYEYPTWFWCYWPWIGLPGKLRERLPAIGKSAAANWSLLREFRCFVEIGDVLAVKRAALAQHCSQVERRQSRPEWFILDDVSGGEWVDCFFQPREIFFRHPAEEHPVLPDPHEPGGRATNETDVSD